MLVNNAAIQRSSQGSFVYIIKPDQTATMQTVTAGVTDGGVTAVQGLQPNDVVAASGFDKLQDGAKVTVRNAAPMADLSGRSESSGRVASDRAPINPAYGAHTPACEASSSANGQGNREPSRPFILRPVATSLLMAAIMLVGIVAYSQLPISALPEVDYPTIQVITFYPGASPDVMASAVTAPLERQFGQVPGLNQMTSTSSAASSVIVLQFSLDLNIDVAEQEVQASINAAQTYLPADLPVPPIYSKTNPADTPILTLALTSKTIPLSQVEDLADTKLTQKIAQLPGVGLVSISGGQKPAIRIQVNPTALSVLRHQHGGRAHGAATDQPDSPRAILTARSRTTRSTPTISC